MIGPSYLPMSLVFLLSTPLSCWSWTSSKKRVHEWKFVFLPKEKANDFVKEKGCLMCPPVLPITLRPFLLCWPKLMRALKIDPSTGITLGMLKGATHVGSIHLGWNAIFRLGNSLLCSIYSLCNPPIYPSLPPCIFPASYRTIVCKTGWPSSEVGLVKTTYYALY